MSILVYSIDKMRVTRPTQGGKVALANPDRVFTVKGVFHAGTVNPDGTVKRGEKLTIVQKEITTDMVADSNLRIDLDAGILVLMGGDKGRTASAGISADEITAALAALRNPEPEPTPEIAVKAK